MVNISISQEKVEISGYSHQMRLCVPILDELVQEPGSELDALGVSRERFDVNMKVKTSVNNYPNTLHSLSKVKIN